MPPATALSLPVARDQLHAYCGDRSFVMSFARGVSVLQAFAQIPRPMTLAEISRSIHIPRAAVRRLLYTLCELGYVKSAGPGYALTPKSLELGTAFTNSSDFILRAQPIVSRLSDRLQTFCARSVQQSEQSMLTCVAGHVPVACVDDAAVAAGAAGVAAPRHRVLAPGSKAPLYASASGLVFLSTFTEAQLDDYFARTALRPITVRTPALPQQVLDALRTVRAKGYATCDRTLDNGVLSVAVPVHDANGRVVASMLVGVAVQRSHDVGLQAVLVPALTAAAREVGLHWD